jgi:hypothetical protein
MYIVYQSWEKSKPVQSFSRLTANGIVKVIEGVFKQKAKKFRRIGELAVFFKSIGTSRNQLQKT